MKAADLLAGSGIDIVLVRQLIAPVQPEDVEVKPAPAVLRRIWGKGIQAMTLIGTVYVDPVILAGPHEANAPLIMHELVHVRQWRSLGVARFLARYVWQYLRGRFAGLGHRDAYLGIGLESEAREATARLI